MTCLCKMEGRLPLRKEDLDVVGDLFGVRVIYEADERKTIELYIEDDEQYFYKCSFNMFWLLDLKEVVNGTLGHIAAEVKRREEALRHKEVD